MTWAEDMERQIHESFKVMREALERMRAQTDQLGRARRRAEWTSVDNDRWMAGVAGLEKRKAERHLASEVHRIKREVGL